MPKVRLSVPQSEAFWSEAPSTAVVAGFGSGKTHSAVVKAFDLLLQFPGVPVGYAAPTYGLIKDIWYPAVEEHCEKHGFKYDINKSDHVIKLDGLGKIVCRSLSNPSKIVGFEVGDFLVDEMDILRVNTAKEGWRKCKARCRYKFPKKRIRLRDGSRSKKKRKKNQMFVYTTPEGFKATYDLFKREPIPNSRLIQMSTYSNEKNLPDGYIDELKANYPPQQIEAYIYGVFTNLTSGTVYPMFSRTLNNAAGVLPVTREPIHVGMDFNVGKMAGIIHVIRNGFPIACGEIINKRDTPDMIFALKNLYPNNRIYVYPDASGKRTNSSNASESDIKLLKQAGFYVVVDRKNPAIKDRVLSMNAMFCNAFGIRRYKVNTEACPVYTQHLEQQPYDDSGMPSKDGDMDHTNDAGGYFIHKKYGIIKPISRSSKLIM